MTLEDIGINEVLATLGAPNQRGNRIPAWWRGGNGLSVAIDPKKNVWFDHRDQRGGGVVDLVQVVLDCDKSAAFRWLQQNCGLDPLKPETYAQRMARAQAPDLARRWADFAKGLKIIAGRRLHLVHHLGLDAEKFRDWHHQAHLLNSATPLQISEIWRECPEQQAVIEALGRDDRIHAAEITTALVDMIATSQDSQRASA